MKNKNHYNMGINNPAYKDGRTNKKHYCIDCKKQIKNPNAKRCQICAGKVRRVIKKQCIHCGKELSYQNGISCQKCDSIRKSQQYKGKNNPMYGRKEKSNPNFKTGIFCTQHYCIDCKVKISLSSFLYGGKRCLSCSKKGEKNFRYRDGKSNEPYPLEFNNKLRESIRKRDNYTCQNCGMTEEKHHDFCGRNLEVHHKDRNKQNNKQNNLIALCKPCHERITLGGKPRG